MIPVKFKPIPVPRIWGGHKLKPQFHTETEQAIGEYWVLSGHPNGTSIVSDGPYCGRSLNDLLTAYPEAFLGISPQPRFPLLIKYLEASRNLSVQVHPDDHYAKAHEEDFGKTEAWYILDTSHHNQVCLGHDFTSRTEFETAIARGELSSHLKFQNIARGDTVFVPAGMLHALLSGTTVIEVQQTSDVTYRVYDWNRLDNHGKPRALHLSSATEVLDFSQNANPHHLAQSVLPNIGTDFSRRRISCPFFSIDEVILNSPNEYDIHHTETRQLQLGHKGNPDVLICVSGSIKIPFTTESGETTRLSLSPGEVGLIPATSEFYEINYKTSSVLLRVYY